MDVHAEIERTMLDMRQGRIAGLREAAKIADEHAEANSKDVNNSDQYFALIVIRDAIRARADELERGE